MLRNLLLITLLFPASLWADSSFSSDRDYGMWSTFYYKNPEPQRIIAGVNYNANSEIYQKQKNTRVPMAHFYATLLERDQNRMGALFSELSARGTKDARTFGLNILWLINSEGSRALLKRAEAEWKDPTYQKIIPQMLERRPSKAIDYPVKTPVALDILWQIFYASGNPKAVKKIISVVHWRKDGHGEQIMVGGAAAWSLEVNAYHHEKVYQILKEELQNSSGTTKQLLNEIVNKVQKQKSDRGA